MKILRNEVFLRGGAIIAPPLFCGKIEKEKQS